MIWRTETQQYLFIFLSFQNSTVVFCFCLLCLLLIILYWAEVEHIFTTYVILSYSNICVNSNYITFSGSFLCRKTYCNSSTKQHTGCDCNNRLIIFFLPVWLNPSFPGRFFQHSGLDFLYLSIKVSGLVFPSQTCSGWQLHLESISGWRWLQRSVCLLYCFPGWQLVVFSSCHCPWVWLKQTLDTVLFWKVQQSLVRRMIF